ncbi:Uncharacterized protein Nst1_255 [Candidatus Nanobsidianus stetteri]|uniref:Uncharacterized protein n=1 Tax=Nanobsidianus stetteri TaxID=1294122 RepID=R1FTX0_NANST|nr:Uncharacterized protein Nst1_255 [Candidatus Nanobsidianus stetteri]
MRSYFYTIILGIISILVLFFILLLNNVNFNNNYILEKTNITIDNQNISVYLLNLYGNGCYLYNITEGYFIIKNKGPGINYIIPLVEYINTTSFVFCNQTFYYNITIKECSPIIECSVISCPVPSCYNITYYINITYPIVIVNRDVFLYNNNVYCYSENYCNIIYQKLPENYLYNLIYNLISSIPKHMV